MKETHYDSKSVDSLNRSRPSKGARKKVSSNKNKSGRQEEIIAKCKFCAGQHKRGQCPAYNKRCNNCQKLNHFAKCCTRPKLRTIKHVDADSSSEDESESEFFIGSIQATEEPSEIVETKQPSETEVVHDSVCQDDDVEIFAIENDTPATDCTLERVCDFQFMCILWFLVVYLTYFMKPVKETTFSSKIHKAFFANIRNDCVFSVIKNKQHSYAIRVWALSS